MAGDPRPPTEVPLPAGYTVVEKLGEGGFATVWLAEQGQLGRRVAVKLLGETLGDDERERRFLAECRAVGRLSSHPAVVTVHDAGTTEEGRPYLVMEHLSGGSLHDRLRSRGPMTWAEATVIGVHVADALSAAHDTGILHRDVKPANVLLDDTGAPKLADFGIARLAEGTATATGHVLGTILYTPPEVLSGQRPAPTADVWALGVMLHTLISGRNPFEGEEAEPPAVSIARVLRSEPPVLPADVPRDLSDLVATMLAADPESRPQSAAEVARRLQTVQAAHGLSVTPARSTRDVVDPVRAGADATVVGFAAISDDLTDRADPPSTPGPPAASSPTVVVPPSRQSASAAGGLPGTGLADGSDARTAGAVPAPDALTGSGSVTDADRGSAETSVVGSTVPVGSAPAARSVADGPGSAAAAGPAPGGPPSPPGSPSPSRRRRPLVVAVVAVALVVVAAVVVATLLDGDDTAGGPGTGSTVDPPDPDPGRAPDQIETIWGVLTTVPTGPSEAPSAIEGGPGQVDCGATFQCGAASVDGEAVIAYPDGSGTLRVDRLTAEGAEVWSTPVDTPAANVSVVPTGEVLLVATVEDDPDSDDPTEELRAYWGLDAGSGDQLWGPTTFDDDLRTLRPTDQVSSKISILKVNDPDGPEVLALDNATGEKLWTGPGRILTADATQVYLAGPGVMARDLATGAPRWTSEVAVVGDGASPLGRLGVVADGVLVTVSGDGVVGLKVTDGTQAWAPQPLSDGGAQLGAALALSAASGLAVVVGQTGDLGIDPGSGTVEWRISRAPLLRQDEANIWIGTADRLLVGQLGGQLRLIATDQAGEELASVEIGAREPSRSSIAFEGGVALLTDDGITAYSTEDLSVRWSDATVAGARTLVTIDGGLVLLGPAGVSILAG